MIKISVIGDSEVIAKLKAMPADVKSALRAKIISLAEKLTTYIKEEKLSGQVLHVRTNRLRSSITPVVTETEGGVYAIVGTNVEYAGVHEFGFQGIVTVKEHLRRAKTGVVRVSAHSRQMNLPERSFLRSALADMTPTIREQLAEAVRNSAKRTLS